MIMGHALPNAMITIVTIVGLQITALLSAVVVVEVVFGWPGLGRLALEAVLEALTLPNVQLLGIHCHIGSQLLDAHSHEDAIEVMVDVVNRTRTAVSPATSPHELLLAVRTGTAHACASKMGKPKPS